MISRFLNYLEEQRREQRQNPQCSPHCHPLALLSTPVTAPSRACAHLCQRVLAIPPKRFERRVVSFLTAMEVDAVIGAPDLSAGKADETRL